MDLKKLAPWNWFKKEEESDKNVIPLEYGKIPKSHGRRPRHPLSLFNEMDDFFNTGIEENLWSSFNRYMPVTPLTDPGLLRPYADISSNDREYSITIEIPGVNEKDVHLEISEDTLIIKGEKRQDHEEKKKNFYRIERSYGSFQRMLSLPDDAVHEEIAAVFNNGVLKITIPRKELPEVKVRSIPIK